LSCAVDAIYGLQRALHAVLVSRTPAKNCPASRIRNVQNDDLHQSDREAHRIHTPIDGLTDSCNLGWSTSPFAVLHVVSLQDGMVNTLQFRGTCNFGTRTGRPSKLVDWLIPASKILAVSGRLVTDACPQGSKRAEKARLSAPSRAGLRRC
jgi:hypothetical protein